MGNANQGGHPSHHAPGAPPGPPGPPGMENPMQNHRPTGPYPPGPYPPGQGPPGFNGPPGMYRPPDPNQVCPFLFKLWFHLIN